MTSAAETLVATRLGADTADRTLLLLHGLYGRGRNWHAVARGVIAGRPEYACWLVDLPHHGDSGRGRHDVSVRGAADDVCEWMAAAGVDANAVLGHSFGGKVALAIADVQRARDLQVWIVDSTPETRAPSGSAWTMLQSVRALPARFASRDALVSALTADGWPSGVGQWMASNLVRDGEGFVWRLDFDVMEHLLHSFFTTDLWPVVEAGAPRHAFHFIKASESSALSEAAVQRLERTSSARATIHRLQGGHWIHADQPQAVIDMLVAALP